MCGAGDRQRRQPIVTADAVFLVHDQIALGDFGGFGDELIGPFAAARRAGDALAQQILLAHHRDAFGDKAAFDAQGYQRHRTRGFTADGGVAVFRRDVLEAVLAQQIGEPFARPARPSGNNDAASLGGPTYGLRLQLVEHVDRRRPRHRCSARGKHRTGAPAAVHAGRPIGHAERGERGAWPKRQHLIPAVAIEVQHPRRNRPIRHLSVARHSFAGLGVVGDHFQPRFQDLIGLVIEADGGVGQIVQQVFHRRMKQRHPVLHPRMAATVGDGQINRVLGRVLAEHVSPCGAEASDRLLAQRHFGDRAQQQGAALASAALRGRIEGADGFDGVAEQVEPDRIGLTGGEDVDDSTAHRVFAGLHDGAGAAVAIGLEECGQFLRLDRTIHRQIETGAGERRAGRHALHQCVDGGQDNARALGRIQQARQGGDAFGYQNRVRRHAVVWQAVPGGKAQHLGFRHGERQGFGQARHAGVVAGDVDDGAAVFAPALSEQERIPPLRRAPNFERFGHRCRLSRIRSSMGVASSGGISRRPVSQSARSTSGSSRTISIASSSSSVKRPRLARTNPPIIRSFSKVPRCVERKSNRRRRASCSGSVIG